MVGKYPQETYSGLRRDSLDLQQGTAQELNPVSGRIKVVLALLLAILVAAALISPAVNVEPTAIHAWNAARNLAAPLCAAIMSALLSAPPNTQALFLPVTPPISPGAADLVALNCTRLC
jgi:hypothetical protein